MPPFQRGGMMFEKELLTVVSATEDSLVVHLIYSANPDNYPLFIYQSNMGITHYYVQDFYSGETTFTVVDMTDSGIPFNTPLRIRTYGGAHDMEIQFSDEYFKKDGSGNLVPLKYGETSITINVWF